MDLANLKTAIKEYANEIGFVAVGFTTADPFPEAEAIMHDRLRRGMLAGLPWFTAKRIETSCRPERQLPQARTLISVALPYFIPNCSTEPEEMPTRGLISRFAWGPDYHQQVRRRLEALIRFIGEQTGQMPAGRTYVDSGWLPERAVATRAGLGFVGKNTNLIVPSLGSWLFLGEILLDLPIAADSGIQVDCGSCDLCLRACPTGALQAPYVLDVNRCLSFLTIEWPGAIPLNLRASLGRRVFGCDACQDVCPWNRQPLPSAQTERIQPDPDWPSPQLNSLLSLTESTFRQRFHGTALKRAKRVGLQRNAAVVAGNLGSLAAVPDLIGLLNDPARLVRQHAAWALGQINSTAARKALFEALSTENDDEVRVELENALRDQTS